MKDEPRTKIGRAPYQFGYLNAYGAAPFWSRQFFRLGTNIYLRGDGLDLAGAYAHYLFECGGKPPVRGADKDIWVSTTRFGVKLSGIGYIESTQTMCGAPPDSVQKVRREQTIPWCYGTATAAIRRSTSEVVT